MNARLLSISGRVQGVGFRDWAVRQAVALGLSGWVRNRRDGSVEMLLQGEADAVAQMLRACRQGPRLAEVTELREALADPCDHAGFERWPTA